MKKLLLTTILVSSVGVAAHAGGLSGGGYETDKASLNKHKDTVQQFRDKLAETEEKLIDLLTKQTQHLSQDARNAIAAEGKLATTKDERDRQLRIDEIKNKAVQNNQTPASACSILTDLRRNGVHANSPAADEYFDMAGSLLQIQSVRTGGVSESGQEALTSKGEERASKIFSNQVIGSLVANGVNMNVDTKFKEEAIANKDSLPFTYDDERFKDAPINIATSVFMNRPKEQTELDIAENMQKEGFEYKYDDTYLERCKAFISTSGNVIDETTIYSLNTGGNSVKIKDELGEVARSSMFDTAMLQYCHKNMGIGSGKSQFDAMRSRSQRWLFPDTKEMMTNLKMDNEVQVGKEQLFALGTIAANQFDTHQTQEKILLMQAASLQTQNLMLKELRRIADSLDNIE